MEAHTTDVQQLRIKRPSLDAVEAERMLRAARAACAAGARALVIDLGGVTVLDSWGISALLRLRKQTPRSVSVVIASMSEAAQRAARVTHLHDVFDIYADARTAVEDLSS